MITIQDIRSKYPDYGDLSDEQLADKLHNAHYSDMPKDEYYQKIGLKSKPIDAINDKPVNNNKINQEALGFDMFGKARLGGLYEKAEKYGVPEIAAGLLAPEIALPAKVAGALGKYGYAALKTALTQGGVAAAFNPEHAGESAKTAAEVSAPFSYLQQLARTGSPFVRKSARLALALGAGYGAHEGTKALTGSEVAAGSAGLLAASLAGRPSINSLARKIEKSAPITKESNKIIEGAKRLGLTHVTPAEASPNYMQGVIQGGIGKSPEGAQKMMEINQSRVASEEKSIENLFKSMYDAKKLKPIEQAAYQEAHSTVIPKKVTTPFKKNETIKAAIKSVEREPEYKEAFKKIKSKDSLEYWDLIKRAIGDRVEDATTNTGRLKNTGRLAAKTQTELVKALDAVQPKYAEARGLAQRRILKEQLESAFNKKEFTGANMAKVLEDKRKFQGLMGSFKKQPEVRQALVDMKRVFPNLIGSMNAKAGAKLEKINVNKPRETLAYLGEKINAVMNGKMDVASVELITNPKWREEFHRLAQVTNKEKRAADAINLFGKIAAQEVARQNKQKSKD